jgi:hypothetical protein
VICLVIEGLISLPSDLSGFEAIDVVIKWLLRFLSHTLDFSVSYQVSKSLSGYSMVDHVIHWVIQ